jgi:mRNA-degrading endonuclease RelE of RelBE toxin-antitoxin system
MADVILAADARRELGKLGREIHQRVNGILARLERWPNVSGAKPLRHGLAGRYRIRTGDYRVQFRVVGNQVIVEKIGHRDGFYEGD